jgi:sugar phosphate isomerase/epimerase
MNRRSFMAALPAVAAARSLFAATGTKRARIGLCTFSSHQHWKAVADKHHGVKFTDTTGFFRYGREIGAEGVQSSLRSKDPLIAKQIRQLVEDSGGYYEAELRLPKDESELAKFETDVRLARDAGAAVARAVCLGGRRYEVFKSLDEFQRFCKDARRALTLAEPVARKHRLKLAIENHKDLTVEEHITLLRQLASEWIGSLVDTGNNMALLDEPHEAVESLAPFAMSVHLKDMAVQLDANGFLLSEVPLGTGLLDLPRIVAALSRAKVGLVFNLEMATRDPLKVPCLQDSFWVTFPPDRKMTHLHAALARAKSNPAKQPLPTVRGKSVPEILANEETNNRQGLAWMKTNLRS